MKIDTLCLSFPIEFCQFGDLAAVDLGRGETQLFFECLLKNLYVFVLAKNERDDQPIVSGAHLSVGAVISQESLVIPARNVRWRPAEFAQLLAERRSLVLDIARRQEFSGRDWFDGSANQNAVHNHIVGDAKGSHGEFVFGGNILKESVGQASEFNSLAGFQVGECDQSVVTGIELEHVEMHRSQNFTEVFSSSGYCKTSVVGCSRRFLNASLLTRPQPPKSLCVTAENTILILRLFLEEIAFYHFDCSRLRLFLEEIAFYHFDCSRVRCGHQAHGPVGANHQPIWSKRFEGDVEERSDLLRTPMQPVGFGDHP